MSLSVVSIVAHWFETVASSLITYYSLFLELTSVNEAKSCQEVLCLTYDDVIFIKYSDAVYSDVLYDIGSMMI